MLLGKKLGMTQLYDDNGTSISVTIIEAGPCTVMQKRPAAKNGGVDAVQLGFEPVKDKVCRKPQLGHAKKCGLAHGFRYVRDMRVDNLDAYESGQILTCELFEVGQYVDVTGTSKGRGFQGVIKRHGHHGGPETHGSMFHRSTGGIGQSAWPARVFKGRGMPGHMGNSRVTVENLTVVAVYPEDNAIAVKGAVPGPTNRFVIIRPALKKASTAKA
jgi:large subunit ribosomal protein L3